jgi:hypothetical protein
MRGEMEHQQTIWARFFPILRTLELSGPRQRVRLNDLLATARMTRQHLF